MLQDILANQLQSLPPILARSEVGKLTGGIISPKTLANLDSLGKGPKERIKIGGKIAYLCDSFIEFLLERAELIRV